MFENLDAGTIITVILGLLTAFFGVFWGKVKGKIGKVVKAGKELMDVGSALTRALEDDKVTKEEVEEIKKEWEEAKAAFKDILVK